MHYGVSYPSFGDLWREAMREKGSGLYSERTRNDEAERAFWHEVMPQKKEAAQDDYAVPIFAAVEEILGAQTYDSILEIGPGWGNYTFGLARHCRRMACVDISPDVLAYISAIASKRGMEIATVASKWEEYQGGPHDVVFAYNCFYRMMEIEQCLRKINETASKLHIIGMTGGPEQAYYPALEHKLGLDINYHRLDYIYLVNVLYQLGMDCNVRLIPIVKEYAFETMDEAVDSLCGRVLTKSFDKAAVREIVEPYFEKAPDGGCRFYHHFHAAILYW